VPGSEGSQRDSRWVTAVFIDQAPAAVLSACRSYPRQP
jgi:hypothetical protein